MVAHFYLPIDNYNEGDVLVFHRDTDKEQEIDPEKEIKERDRGDLLMIRTNSPT